MRPEDWAKVHPFFQPHEFDHPERMGYEFMLWITEVRKELGMTLTPSSDGRSIVHNADVGGAKRSAHLDPILNVLDFSGHNMTGIKRLQLFAIAYQHGCRRFGIYANGSVHLDRTEDVRPEACWVKV